jgi:hydrogenase maturation protein HypF
VAEAISQTCRRIRAETRLERVCLSGGTFQNMKLLKGTAQRLRGQGFEVFLQSRVPPNDGGIALGQAAMAAELLRRG